MNKDLKDIAIVLDESVMSKGLAASGGYDLLQDFVAPYDATLVEKLKTNGLVISNLGSTPHNESISDSQVALGVMSGKTKFSDEFNYKYCFKPTYGAISRYGIFGMASSMDTVSLFSNSLPAITGVMDVVAGQDKEDAMTVADYFKPLDEVKKPLKIGVLEPINAFTENAIEELKRNGHQASKVDISVLSVALPIYNIVASAEFSSNMARLDGVRYGKRSQSAKNLTDIYQKSRTEHLGDVDKLRILLGTFIVSSGYYEDYYLKAQRARTLLINQLNELFDHYDLLLSSLPSSDSNNRDDFKPENLFQINNIAATIELAGLPAVTIHENKLSGDHLTGAQLVGAQKADGLVLAVAGELEQ